MEAKKLFIGLFFLVLVIGLTACSGDMPFSKFANNKDPANSNFYQGTQGVVMRMDQTSPPANMYYYEDQLGEADAGYAYDIDDNAFDIFVDVHNVGASWAKGGIFVSGYDPNMIQINEINIHRMDAWADCGLTLASTNQQGTNFFDSVGFSMSCLGVGGVYSYGQGQFGGAVSDLGNLFSTFTGDTYDNTWWDDISIAYDNSYPGAGQGGQFAFHMEMGQGFNYNNLNRGKGMLILLAGLSFQRYNGIEYILAPDDYDYPGGEQTTIQFTGNIYTWPPGLDRVTGADFLVTNCYAYTTYAAPSICIDPDPYGTSEKVCIPKEITFNGGNGAPVAVTYIETENTKTRAMFTIHVANQGSGIIYDLMQMERCSPYYPGRLTSSYYDKIYLLDARIGNQRLQCTPSFSDGIRLTNGQGQFRCSYIHEYVGSRSAYETPLILELGYGYSESTRRSVSIKRAL